MKIVLLTHPEFVGSNSMPRYSKMLGENLKSRGHQVDYLTAPSFFNRAYSRGILGKWLGYVDQFIIFPLMFRWRLLNFSKETLFVFTDHALGPWVPLVKRRKHVIHCHDFLAQKSALGEIRENITGISGKLYQRFIRNGYKQGRNFISISKKTKFDLETILGFKPDISVVLYNAINPIFSLKDKYECRKLLKDRLKFSISEGYLLHVGGNQWYKNRKGVIYLYEEFRKKSDFKMPLLLIGKPSDKDLFECYEDSLFKDDIHFLTDFTDEDIHIAYAGASLFLFPSFAEGFGWPIAEAMASGCLVLTTGEAPMTEVGGDCAFYHYRMPNDYEKWAKDGAIKIIDILNMDIDDKSSRIAAGLKYVEKFGLNKMIEQVEIIYANVV